MAAIFVQKNRSKRARNGAFLGLREFPKRKTVSKLETNSLVKVMTKKKVKRVKKTLAMSLGRRYLNNM